MTTASSKSSPPAAATPPHNGFSLISNEKLLQLYSTMLKCSMLHARIGVLANGNGPASLLAALSHEATAVGVCLDLLPGDTLAPSPHGLIPSFVKGLPLASVFSVVAPNGSKPRSPYARVNLISPVLGLKVQLDRAISAAIANKKTRNKQIVVVFCGHSNATPDLLHETMRSAGKRNLPILLVCRSESDSDEMCAKALEYDFPGVAVDADDAIAVYRVATEAMAHARRGSGPTLIDCKPWPLSGHKPGHRKAAGNPILRMEEYLTRKGLFDKKFKSEITASFRRELESALNAEGIKPV
jgi:TPP-dependent pyruvate/acetoin dehydrogenase alpha subunit